MNPKHFSMRAIGLGLTLIAWVGSGQYTTDNSDWWSLFREEVPDACSTPRKEKPNGANFVIAGVELRHQQPIHDAEEKVAKPSVVIERGDASTGRAQICFKSTSDRGRFKLIFEEAEVSSAAYLIDGGPGWNGSDKCVASEKVSRKLATASGLHLGMTVAEVKKILGKPCFESKDRVEYAFVYQYLLPLEERRHLQKSTHFSAIDPDEPFDWFGTVQIKFRNAEANYIAILTGETQ